MPALPIIDNVFRVALRWGVVRGSPVNVMHFYVAGGNPPALFAAIDAEVEINMWKTVSGDIAVSQVDILPLDGTSSTQSFITGSPAKWTGQGGVGDFVPSLSTIVKMKTGLRGRSRRGRIFLPYCPENKQVNGDLDAGEIATMQASWSDFLDDMAAASAPLVVASYKLADFDPVTQLIVEARGATQRRRQRP